MNDNTLQEIKDRLDLVDLISSYIPVKRGGANFKAPCPFHNEKTPSLMISPQKQIWHCFGCGAGGDVFGFVMRYENLEFREALQVLAQRAGVKLPEYNAAAAQAKDHNEELTRVNNFSARYYHKLLETAQGANAKSYLLERGLKPGTIERWSIGFAPNAFDSLLNALAAKKVSLGTAVQAGVLTKNDNGKIYDRFRNRVTFPIHNYYGDVVGFSARTLDSVDVAKYINSPETPIYNKSKVLFGLHFAREAIRKSDEVVVVEGQMDCIQAHQAGFTNTVATSGTALTQDHLRIIGRLTKNLKFCFDSDNAGLAALRRAGELALPLGFRIKVITLQGAKDPDELIKNSPLSWKKSVAEAVWFADFYLDYAAGQFALGSIEQKRYISDEVVPLLRYVVDPLERDHYIRRISERFSISETAVRSALKSPSQTVGLPQPMGNTLVQTSSNTSEAHQKEILGGVLLYPEFRAFVREEGLSSEDLDAEIGPIINLALSDDSAVSSDSSLAKEATFMVESTLENLANNELALMRELKKSFHLFKLAGIKLRLQDVTMAIKKAESLHDTAGAESLKKSFTQLSAERYTLEKKVQG